MPTKKQRRRQQKSRRHEYEYVYVDDEGNEVEVDPAELRSEKDERRSETRARTGNNNRGGTQRDRSQRGIQPPSWRRAAKRGLLFGPLLVVAMMLLNRNVSTAQQIAPAVFLIAFFIPFSYFTDSLAYRMYRRRLERRNAPKTR